MPLVIGHRGFAARYPENTVAGVRAAIAVGADGVEVDIRPCRDGTWVCHHDRTRDGEPIAAWPLDRLARAGVPAFGDVIAALPADRWLFVEIKPLGALALDRSLPALIDLLHARPVVTRVISSSLPVLATIAGELPNIPTSWVFADFPDWLPVSGDLSPAHRHVEALLDTHRALHPWTVDRADRARALARAGVASITSNRPDLVLEALHG